jgi:hypothetical protein
MCEEGPSPLLEQALKEIANLKAALKELLDGERKKLVSPDHLDPFITRFIARHHLNPEEFK